MTDDEVMWWLADAAWLYVERDERTRVVGWRAWPFQMWTRLLERSRVKALGGLIETVGDAGSTARFTDAEDNMVSFIEVSCPVR